MRNPALARGIIAAAAALLPTCGFGEEYLPRISPASDEAERAIRRFRLPEGYRASVFAAEPLLANPVAFCIDEKGRFFVAETFRLHAGVTDNRRHMDWLDDDLACRTVEDRVRMYEKHLGAKATEYGIEQDRVRRIVDSDGDGKADASTVFADGFSRLADGIGSGVLARRGAVYFACIPDLWLLRDTDGDGRADERTSLHHGYGVHVAFLGHDLHGLAMGPDGRLYFSIGDRGLAVESQGKRIDCPDTGAVLRCNPDGTELELFATGLRNPQELAFDEFGNLFTGDNNSDSGDKARWVHVVEGSDAGWRMSFQYISQPVARGPWNAEKLWLPAHKGQPAYIVPPVANIADGPSGFCYHPGTGMTERERGRFFLADFRGTSALSGVRSFRLKAKGASFELTDPEQFLWAVLATDVQIGHDGAMYLTDWVEGWEKPNKGRIYRIAPEKGIDPRSAEVQRIFAEGFVERPSEELASLLAHPDQRVRLEAQLALVERGPASAPILRAAAGGPTRWARLHGLWGLGILARTNAALAEPILEMVSDSDEEVRAQAAKVLGEAHVGAARIPIERMLEDPSPRVRLCASIALARIGDASSAEPIARLLERNADEDPVLRHAACLALAGIGDRPALERLARDPSRSVRLGALLAYRRLADAAIAIFLDDPDPFLVEEAARAIHDAPIEGARAALAERLDRRGLSDFFLRRSLHANLRLGTSAAAERIAALARDEAAPEIVRTEAIELLANWSAPSPRDGVMGLWRPIPHRDAAPAAAVFRRDHEALLGAKPWKLRRAAAKAVAAFGVAQAAPVLVQIVEDGRQWGALRAEALRALESLGDERLQGAVRRALLDKDLAVRTEAARCLSKLDPAQAVGVIETMIETGPIAEKQQAIAILGVMKQPAADPLLVKLLAGWRAETLAPEVRLDVLLAAAGRNDPTIARLLGEIEAARSKDDPLAPYRETLVGGDAASGERIFRDRTAVACLRCHKLSGEGGEVGPDLTGIGGKKSREYLLESIVAPDRSIAQGFDTAVLATADGAVHVGVLRGETEETFELITADAKKVTVPKADVVERTRGKSAMPEDLRNQLTKADLRDLIEFLASLR